MDDTALENLVTPLLTLIGKEKHDKAAKRLVAWLNKVGYDGADELVTPLMGGLAMMCAEYDVPASFLDNRVPPISGVAMSDLARSTVLAQQIVAAAVDRIKRGQSPVMSEQEHELLWETDVTSVLCIYYWLQCIAASSKLDGMPRVVAALYAPEPVEDSIEDSVDG